MARSVALGHEDGRDLFCSPRVKVKVQDESFLIRNHFVGEVHILIGASGSTVPTFCIATTAANLNLDGLVSSEY